MDLKKLERDFNKEITDLTTKEIEDFCKSKIIPGSKTSQKTLEKILSELPKYNIEDVSHELAEVLSYIVLEKIYPEAMVNYKLGSTSFPDIEVDDVGFEVKKSLQKETLGNSVLQNDPELSEIYVIIFKDKNVSIKRYEDIIDSIVVDHNPRFKLSLSGASQFKEFFGMSLVQYLALPIEEKSELIKKYLHKSKDGKEWLWYMGKTDAEILSVMLDKMEEQWKKLDNDQLRIYIFCEHFNVFNDSNYMSLRNRVIEKFQCWGPVKDVFTGSGREEKHDLPKVFGHLLRLLPEIKSYIEKNALDLKKWKEEIIHLVQNKNGKSVNQNGLTSDQIDLLKKKIREL